MSETEKTYQFEDLIVKWVPHKCIHSGICFNGLPTVFDPRQRPWVNITGASKEEIAQQVKKCPSGALSVQKDEKA